MAGSQYDEILQEAARNGRITAVIQCLQNGAYVDCRNSDGRTPLMHAAQNGHTEIVKLLLEAGANISLEDKHGYTALRCTSPKDDIVSLLKNYEPVQKPDEVIFESRLTNRTLQEIFNFTRREKITLLRQGPYGPVEAMSSKKFSEMTEDEPMLREAFEEHRRRGGKTEESTLFPNRLLKPLPRQKNQ